MIEESLAITTTVKDEQHIEEPVFHTHVDLHLGRLEKSSSQFRLPFMNWKNEQQAGILGLHDQGKLYKNRHRTLSNCFTLLSIDYEDWQRCRTKECRGLTFGEKLTAAMVEHLFPASSYSLH